MGSHRRDEVQILCDILKMCFDGTAKTNIVYRANLNFVRLNKYVNMLLGLGYISLSVECGQGSNSNLRIVYRTTEQGKSFLANFQSMQQGLERLSYKNEALAKPLTSSSR